MKVLSSQEIINAHKGLQSAIYQFERHARSLATDVECLRNAAQRVEDAKKDLPVESLESQEKIDYTKAAEQHICDCFNGTAVNSPRPANFTVGMYRKPGAGVAPANGDNEEKPAGPGGLSKFA
jgi:hypothetical protein